MSPEEEAIDAGALALFGEKYGDSVRVLTLGRALDGEGAYSVELCGGTHVARTGDIALFKIVSESGVAAGVRRIEALTGEPARRYLLDQAGVAKGLAEQFKVPVAEVAQRVDALQAEKRLLEKQLGDAKRQLAVGGGGAAAGPEDIGGIKVIARVLDGVGGKELRGVAEDFKKQVGSGVVALVGTADGKAAITVAVRCRPSSAVSARWTWPRRRSAPWAARARAASPTSPRAARPTPPRPTRASRRSRRRSRVDVIYSRLHRRGGVTVAGGACGGAAECPHSRSATAPPLAGGARVRASPSP